MLPIKEKRHTGNNKMSFILTNNVEALCKIVMIVIIRVTILYSIALALKLLDNA